MSSQPRRILVVTPSVPVARKLFTWLSEAGHEPTVVTTFDAAKAHLETPTDLVITELKLKEYNGLHVALRAVAAGIPATVLGHADDVLRREAEQLGADYLLARDLTKASVLSVIDSLSDAPNADAAEHEPWEDTTPQTLPASGQLTLYSPMRAPGGRSGRVAARPIVH